MPYNTGYQQQPGAQVAPTPGRQDPMGQAMSGLYAPPRQQPAQSPMGQAQQQAQGFGAQRPGMAQQQYQAMGMQSAFPSPVSMQPRYQGSYSPMGNGAPMQNRMYQQQMGAMGSRCPHCGK